MRLGAECANDGQIVLRKVHPEDFIPLVKALSEKENKSEKVFLIIDNIYAPPCPELVALMQRTKMSKSCSRFKA